MATLYITEYAMAGYSPSGAIAVAKEQPLAEQTVAIAATSAACTAFNQATQLVRIHTDAICSIKFGPGTAAPTAVATSRRLAANQTEYFDVSNLRLAGSGGRLAVITNS